ncbi:MAG: hypothetical protein BBJ57_02485 [Desulfobacterales bacterium PC51MH44]|nr:MAG: hypothetical protein BBJ57_02485 [Desulfobacterales bacterium PC51MH44]
MYPEISVCIPTYNGEKYLRECLDSVLSQTFSDFEVLIVDDQSTDDTFDIALAYASRAPHIRVVRNERNLGLVRNWNHCIELAQGEWIKFVFQDDFIAPTCLEKMVAANKNGKPFIVCRREYLFDGHVEPEIKEYRLNLPKMDSIFDGNTEISARDFCNASLDYLGINFLGEPTSVMLHRSVFDRFGRFNSDLIQICDLEYWMRVANQTGLVYVPETLATFRVHSSTTSALNWREREYCKDILDPLILQHEFAYHPAFAPLRATAEQRQPPVNFADNLAKKALWAFSLAERAANNPKKPNSEPLSEWKKVVNHYSRLEKPFQQRLLQLHHWMERHLLWRFKK